ncbi:MAG: hypothetical protein JSS49_29005 [Planctomycetes bacterium]|nr:hypothetical protein [Planctomycetota bacterium]
MWSLFSRPRTDDWMQCVRGLQRWWRADAPSAQVDLDTVLLNWTRQDPYTVRDFVNGGIAVLGRTGSGKTSSSGRLLAEMIVRFPRSGGLILGSKPEDRTMWEAIFANAERSSDLQIFGADQASRFNFLDYAQRLSNEPRNIVHCIQTIGEGLRDSGSQSNSDEQKFWKLQEERLLYCTVVILKLARGTVTASDMQSFIADAATSPEQLRDPRWAAGIHSQWLEAANQASKSEVDAFDFDLAIEYWLGFPSIAEKTRSCIVAGVMGVLHVLNTGIVRLLTSGETNCGPDELFYGKWIFVDMSPAAWGVAGNFVCSGWKYFTQRAVLKRSAGDNDYINVIWMDEAHLFVNSYDATYVAQCRSHRGCMVMLSQSLSSFFAAMSGKDCEHQTRSLLANFSHVVVHATDPVTAEWASGKLGKQRETFFGGSIQPSGDFFDELFGSSRFTGSYAEQYQPVLQERVFMNGLRTGGRANGFICDAIVIRSGEPFASGANWLWREFSQKVMS